MIPSFTNLGRSRGRPVCGSRHSGHRLINHSDPIGDAARSSSRQREECRGGGGRASPDPVLRCVGPSGSGFSLTAAPAHCRLNVAGVFRLRISSSRGWGAPPSVPIGHVKFGGVVSIDVHYRPAGLPFIPVAVVLVKKVSTAARNGLSAA